MSMAVWKRPSSHSWPQVWRHYENISIEDLPQDREVEALEFIKEHMYQDEPLARSIKLAEDPQSMSEITKLFENALSDHVSLIAVNTLTNEMAGINIIRVIHRDGSDEEEEFAKMVESFKGTASKKLAKMVHYIDSRVNTLKHFGVDHMLDSLGLAVHPDYRQKGVGRELVWARTLLAKKFNIPITKSIFTGLYSQRIARTIGLQELFELKYDQFLEPDGSLVFGDTTPHVSALLMAGPPPDIIPPPAVKKSVNNGCI